MGRSFIHLDKSLEPLPKTHEWMVQRYRKLKGDHGRNLCRQCGNEVPPRRSSYCSKECAHAWLMMTSSSYARDQVFSRDQGVCALCKLDTKTCPTWKQSKWLSEWGRDWRTEKRTWLKEHGFDTWVTHLWEADHIIAVVDGGHDLGLDNYQTLCIPCHRRKTAELAARRALERKRAMGMKPVKSISLDLDEVA